MEAAEVVICSSKLSQFIQSKPKRIRKSTKARVHFVYDLLIKNPGKVYRLHELVEQMPEEIRGKDFNAIETLRERLRGHPNILVEKQKHVLTVRLKDAMHLPSVEEARGLLSKYTEDNSDPYAAPPLQLNWFQLGYLWAVLDAHVRKQKDKVVPGIRDLLKRIEDIASVAYENQE